MNSLDGPMDCLVDQPLVRESPIRAVGLKLSDPRPEFLIAEYGLIPHGSKFIKMSFYNRMFEFV